MPVCSYQKCALSLFVRVVSLFVCACSPAQDAPVGKVKIQVDTTAAVNHISPDFIGFGYETSAVAQSNYFSGDNPSLIHLYRNLSPHGLIRIGGNVSDHTKYVSNGIPAVHTDREVTIINWNNLTNLAAFARATGWKVMWGLNLGTGTQEEAAEEAVAVAAALGDSLHSFEIGNEVEFHSGYDWNGKDYDSYYARYLAFKAAVRRVLPQAAFSGPDAGGNPAWVANFAKTEADDSKLLTLHYYRADAKSRDATLENLLKPHPSWNHKLERLQQISRSQDRPFRINEVNSFSGGGKPEVSDTFGSALWCLDYLFLLASYGCEGVNLETDINQHAWISHYSPVVHDPDGHCSAGPEYYGLLAFSMAGKGDLLKLNLEKNDINLTAYATREETGDVWITVINKDLLQDAELEVTLPEGYATANAFRMQAPSAESKDRITFAGGKFSTNGEWIAGKPEATAVKQGGNQLLIPRASAVLLRLER